MKGMLYSLVEIHVLWARIFASCQALAYRKSEQLPRGERPEKSEK